MIMHKKNGLLSSCSKSKLIDLMTKHNVHYIDLPFVTEELFVVTNTIDEYDDDVMEDRVVCNHFSFVPDEQLRYSSKTKKLICKFDENERIWILLYEPSVCLNWEVCDNIAFGENGVACRMKVVTEKNIRTSFR